MHTLKIYSFKVFLEAEDMTLDKAYELIGGDSTGRILRIMLDKYAYSLARSTNKARSTNTCLAYFGNVKNWLLDMYPQQGAIRVKTALLQGISLFKDSTCFLTCPLFTLAAALTMQTAPNKRFFPQLLTTKRSAINASAVDELSLVELLEADDSPGPLQDAHPSSAYRAVPGAQAYVNRLLVRVNEAAQKKRITLTPGLTSQYFRRGAAMHATEGTLAENWIIERGGWQLDRVNKAFGYMLGTPQADQRVARVLSGWSPKQGARLPSLHALDPPIRDRAHTFQALLFAGTLGFADTALNLDETVSECFAATLITHYPDIVLSRRAASSPRDCSCDASTVLQFVKHQSEQIEVFILQNKRLEDRQLALDAQLRTQLDIPAISERPSGQPAATRSVSQVQPTVHPKKKGSQTLSAVWYEWFTAETCVYVSRSVRKTALYEFRHAVGYMMLFLPMGLALDEASPAFKSETLNLGQKAEANTLVFLKANGSSALAAGTALKALRKLHKDGKLDAQITQFHERVANGSIVDPTPASVLPAFIRMQPNL
ncbi:unnamed protein product [Phytophthora fragariaefolia]|uniref:Unnamed protein product n=1 Tax=Phytophthora fragariaefolia TaxID=1490495 RepID=A0A9W6WSE4_9STRA|nr:unnamed protein product [Phytophthora fragariaefolia]